MRAIIFVVVVLSLVAFSTAHSFQKCSCEPNCSQNQTQPTDVTVNTLDISPDPPVKGQNIKLSATATSKVKLDTNSKVTADIFYTGIKIDSLDLPFDSTTTSPFPVQSGAFSYSTSILIPAIAPSGSYVIDAVFKDAQGTARGCVEVLFSV